LEFGVFWLWCVRCFSTWPCPFSTAKLKLASCKSRPTLFMAGLLTGVGGLTAHFPVYPAPALEARLFTLPLSADSAYSPAVRSWSFGSLVVVVRRWTAPPVRRYSPRRFPGNPDGCSTRATSPRTPSRTRAAEAAGKIQRPWSRPLPDLLGVPAATPSDQRSLAGVAGRRGPPRLHGTRCCAVGLRLHA
jgi:hypothetical protein